MLRKLPLALLTAALLIAGVSLLGDDRTPSDTQAVAPAAADPVTIDAVNETVGLNPPEERVAFWRARVESSSADYLGRAQLGASLLALAKRDGDLTLYEEAEAVYRDALAINAQYVPARLGLGSARAAQHDFATALEQAAGVYAEDPDNLSALAALGDANLELGNYDEAERLYTSLAEREGSAPATSRLARLAFLQGDPDRAIELAFEAAEAADELALGPSDVAFYRFQLATFLYGAGDLTAARAELEAGVETDPDHLPSLELLPKVLVAQGDLDAAIARYEELVALTPAADLHGQLAKLYEATGNQAGADEQIQLGLEAGRESAGRFPAERRHLAEFFAEHDPVLALELAEADIAIRQDIGAYDTLAWALYMNGRFEEAGEAMAEALRLGTRDATLLFHAGMIADANDAKGQARRLLSDALEINPGFDVEGAQLARETLDELS